MKLIKLTFINLLIKLLIKLSSLVQKTTIICATSRASESGFSVADNIQRRNTSRLSRKVFRYSIMRKYADKIMEYNYKPFSFIYKLKTNDKIVTMKKLKVFEEYL